MIGKIKSHPEIYLHQHINQIKMVIEQGILPWHSEKTITAKIKELLDKSAVFHDLGKANQAFQKYIVDTKQYRGSKQEKTHTLLSLIITLAVAQEEQWDEDDILILAAVIKGHHSRLPTIPQKQIGAINCPVWDIDNFVQTEKRKILKKQLAVLKFMDLEAETGIKLSNMKMLNSLLGEPRKTIGVLGKNLVEIIKTHFQSMSVTAAVDFRL
ncbi:CRISPR-associated endonuclease Cas3'', partial [Peptococcaceae bacterium]|nr:CRISPR-associated endonuclease Cas3'' [Peptococcaceae bacterium]